MNHQDYTQSVRQRLYGDVDDKYTDHQRRNILSAVYSWYEEDVINYLLSNRLEAVQTHLRGRITEPGNEHITPEYWSAADLESLSYDTLAQYKDPSTTYNHIKLEIVYYGEELIEAGDDELILVMLDAFEADQNMNDVTHDGDLLARFITDHTMSFNEKLTQLSVFLKEFLAADRISAELLDRLVSEDDIDIEEAFAEAQAQFDRATSRDEVGELIDSYKEIFPDETINRMHGTLFRVIQERKFSESTSEPANESSFH